MKKIKVSVVSYLNSKPFIYGLQNSELNSGIHLQLDIPSVCGQKLIEGKVDIGLIPVAVIPSLKESYIISDYCIGADGKVGSVMLYSQVPLGKIKKVLLDYQSRTSITLVQVLAENFWKISPEWVKAKESYENGIGGTTAAVIIGDRTFGLEKRYEYAYDLAEEWQKFTQLPFVFACWVANKKLSHDFIDSFNLALKKGLDNRPKLIKELITTEMYDLNIEEYLTKSINYDLNNPKKKALELFLNYMKRQVNLKFL